MSSGWILRETPRTEEEQREFRESCVKNCKSCTLESGNSDFTCDGCGLAARCMLAFDCYNHDGDCLLEK